MIMRGVNIGKGVHGTRVCRSRHIFDNCVGKSFLLFEAQKY